MPTFGQEEIDNLKAVIETGSFGDKQGGFMDQYRSDVARLFNVEHTMVGATAMLLMQVIPPAIGAGAGDEIICDPVVQFHGIACLHNNVVPVWADVRADDFLLDADKVEEKITARTKAIWVTHLWGFPAEVDKLRAICDKHNIYLIEDCAHAFSAQYKGKYLGLWGHIGTFSHNMGKQLPTGEGGTAITTEPDLAAEMNKRIIFGESPEVLSSNYRWTEFEAAVGVVQLKKIQGYLEEYRKGKVVLDEAVSDCDWLDARVAADDSVVAPYYWSCLFHGERSGIEHGVFKAALRQAEAGFGMGFTQKPAYMYNLFRDPSSYGVKGWPFNYEGTVQVEAGTCPVAEDVIPRLVGINNMRPVETIKKEAEALKRAIKLAESGDVEPLEYSELDMKVLHMVRDHGPLEAQEVIEMVDSQDLGHFDEHGMTALLEDLRDRSPYKLSHAGPRKYAYHDLS